MNPLQIVGAIIGVALTSGVIWYLRDCEVTKKVQAQAVLIAQEARIKAEKETERLNQEALNADHANKVNLARIAALSRSLRDARAASSFLPPASPLATSPQRACFDSAQLERALQRFDTEVAGLIAEGDAARVTLDDLKAWSNTALRPHQ